MLPIIGLSEDEIWRQLQIMEARGHRDWMRVEMAVDFEALSTSKDEREGDSDNNQVPHGK
jgi:hypothetical protein